MRSSPRGRRLGLCIGTLLAAAALALPALAAPARTVATQYGPVRGKISDGVAAYLGMPYAAPPVGPRRWRPPAPPAPWTRVRQAAAFGGSCPQDGSAGYFADPSSTEDCLYINVVAPARAKAGARLPVMVWIHGGGLTSGYSGDYDMSALAKAGVVVVSFDYRVGLLGFFAHPALDAGRRDVGDYGVMDQQFALRWVQRNIAAFGGDPAKVTIFGQSAGAYSVLAHLISPGSAHLFARAIVQSGTGNDHLIAPLAMAEETGKRFAAAVGCTDAACLRALPVDRIVAAQGPYLSLLIGDTTTFPLTFRQALATGRFNRAPVIVGATHDEWRWPIAADELRSGKPVTAEGYPAAVAGFFGPAAPKIIAQYPLAKYASPSEALGAAETDGGLGCDTYKLARWISPFAPVYAYQFDEAAAPMYMPAVSFPYGASHTIELQFIFPGFHGGSKGTVHPLNGAERSLSREMVAYWTGFAKTGNPNGPGLPAWPRYAARSHRMLSLKTPAPVVMTGFAAQHQCGFWEALFGG